jgi:hypothetical protein
MKLQNFVLKIGTMNLQDQYPFHTPFSSSGPFSPLASFSPVVAKYSKAARKRLVSHACTYVRTLSRCVELLRGHRRLLHGNTDVTGFRDCASFCGKFDDKIVLPA